MLHIAAYVATKSLLAKLQLPIILACAWHWLDHDTTALPGVHRHYHSLTLASLKLRMAIDGTDVQHACWNVVQKFVFFSPLGQFSALPKVDTH